MKSMFLPPKGVGIGNIFKNEVIFSFALQTKVQIDAEKGQVVYEWFIKEGTI